MIHLKELDTFLHAFLKVDDFYDYCPNGLQVEGKLKIKKVAMAVSATIETIEQAALKKADALIVHHGLIWQKEAYGGKIIGAKKRKLELLLKHEISLFGYHLPLDAHSIVGNNWKAAMDLGWEKLKPFGSYNKMIIGVKGTFQPVALKDFQAKLEGYYGHRAIVSLGGKDLVSSAALISGGAHRELFQAADEGVDCFVTGSFDEPSWYEAIENKINFFALGHNATERIGPKALGKEIEKTFQIEVEFLNIDNPF